MMKTVIFNIGFLLVIIFNACDDQATLYDFDEPGNLVPKTTAEDPLLPAIEINGTRLHCEWFGNIQNPIIILMPGGPGSDYRGLISQIGVENASRYPNERTITNGGLSQLQDEYFCVFYDQRGAGLSPRFDKGEVNFDLYMKDLDAIIDYFLEKKKNETGIIDTQVYLFGYSYGGTVATGYVNRNPDKVKDVVTYEPGPFSEKAYKYAADHTTPYSGQIGKEWLEEYMLSLDHFSEDDHARADYRSLLGASRSNPQFHENQNYPMWRVGSLLGFEEDLQKQDRDNVSNLSSFKGRFLFIGGEPENRSYPEYANIQMSYYPRSEYAEIPGVGHTGPWENPEAMVQIIRNFFQNK